MYINHYNGRCDQNDYATKGVAGAGLGFGIAGTVALANQILGGGNGGGVLFGGGNTTMKELAAKDAEIAELKAKQYAEETAQALYNKQVAENKELSGFLCGLQARVATLEGQIETDKAKAETALLKMQLENERAFNAYKGETDRRIGALEASVPLVQERCMGAVFAEREKRECADNAMVNYMNATFYPKLVADVTAGTTTTAQVTYNPLPCQCKCAA